MKRIQYGIAGAALVLSLVSCASVPEQRQAQEDALLIAEQGFFASGGTVTEPVPGTYDPATNWLDAERPGNTAHVDHANTFYQIPAGGGSGFCGRGILYFSLISLAAVLPVQQCA